MPLSTKQMEYLALAWQSFENEPKINYEHFAKVAGLASAHSGRELLRVTKKKLKEEYGFLSGEMQASNAATTSKAKAKGRGRPSAAAAATASSPAPASSAADEDDATAAGTGTASAGKKQASLTPIKTTPVAGRKRGRPAATSVQADSPLAGKDKSTGKGSGNGNGKGNGKGRAKASTVNNSADQTPDHDEEDDAEDDAEDTEETSPVSNKKIKIEPDTTTTGYEGGDEMVGHMELFQ